MSNYKLSTEQIDMFWYIAVALVVVGAAWLHPGLGLIAAGVLLGMGVIKEEMDQEREDAKKEEGSLEI